VTVTAAPDQSSSPVDRKPRKVFLLVGLLLATALGIGLFTSVGTHKDSGAPHAGDQVPAFTAARVIGSGTVAVPKDGGGNGHPAVLLFFGNWCTVCHSELPLLAAAVRRQDSAGGQLAQVRVIGVDSEDTMSDARAFIASSGVTFPVAYDPNVNVTSGDFYFVGDPYAVFVNGNGTISDILAGPISAARFQSAERKLTPSGN
jgi:thiol-disulfide isomerase/thioredoxin